MLYCWCLSDALPGVPEPLQDRVFFFLASPNGMLRASVRDHRLQYGSKIVWPSLNTNSDNVHSLSCYDQRTQGVPLTRVPHSTIRKIIRTHLRPHRSPTNLFLSPGDFRQNGSRIACLTFRDKESAYNLLTLSRMGITQNLITSVQ